MKSEKKAFTELVFEGDHLNKKNPCLLKCDGQILEGQDPNAGIRIQYYPQTISQDMHEHDFFDRKRKWIILLDVPADDFQVPKLACCVIIITLQVQTVSSSQVYWISKLKLRWHWQSFAGIWSSWSHFRAKLFEFHNRNSVKPFPSCGQRTCIAVLNVFLIVECKFTGPTLRTF